MKIAITADVHLKTKKETPERYHALEEIFEQVKIRGIDNLIIAGDLFDKDFSNYSEFDTLCKNFYKVRVTLIPGNHDHQINNRFFTAQNIEIINEIKIREFDGITAVFIPYDSVKSIDEALSEYAHRQKFSERWILIGHGDYVTGSRELNPYEPGFYMPLTIKSILKFNPLKVFLGHIHKPSEFGRVFYPGSPCGLDITETGKRRFLIYDTILDSVDIVFVNAEKIYFNESITVLPFEEESQFLERKIYQMIESWGLSKNELNKVVMRLYLKGYVRDLKKTTEFLKNILSSFKINLHDKDGLDSSAVKVLKETDTDRLYLLEKVQEKIEKLCIADLHISKEKILEKSMELIFKE